MYILCSTYDVQIRVSWLRYVIFKLFTSRSQCIPHIPLYLFISISVLIFIVRKCKQHLFASTREYNVCVYGWRFDHHIIQYFIFIRDVKCCTIHGSISHSVSCAQKRRDLAWSTLHMEWEYYSFITLDFRFCWCCCPLLLVTRKQHQPFIARFEVFLYFDFALFLFQAHHSFMCGTLCGGFDLYAAKQQVDPKKRELFRKMV